MVWPTVSVKSRCEASQVFHLFGASLEFPPEDGHSDQQGAGFGMGFDLQFRLQKKTGPRTRFIAGGVTSLSRMPHVPCNLSVLWPELGVLTNGETEETPLVFRSIS